MSIRTSMISVVVRKDSVNRLCDGGVEKFKEAHKIYHPQFEDENLLVYSYMNGMDVEHKCEELKKYGLKLEQDNKFVDMAVVEFFPTLECDWLKLDEDTGEYDFFAGNK